MKSKKHFQQLGLFCLALCAVTGTGYTQETPPDAADSQANSSPKDASESPPPNTNPQTDPDPAASGESPAPETQDAPGGAISESQNTEPAATIPVAESKPKKAKTVTAQETFPDDAVHLDTIEVTASKRLKTQRDIPGSVGAIRGETLEKMGAQSMKDYLKLVPGVQLSENGEGADRSIPIIRGIATSSGFSSAQLPTGIYVDDLPFTDLSLPLSVPDLNPFDLERVEILKGPQGTLFGSGALAGAVRFVLRKPQLGIWEGKLQQTFAKSRVGSLSPVSAGAINIPLGDVAAIRAVGVYRRDGGTTDDTTRPEKDVDQVRQNTWRVLGGWNPLERLNLSAFYFSQSTRQADSGATTFPDRFERAGLPPYAEPTASGLTGANLQVAYDFDWGRLLSSSNRVTKRISLFAQGAASGTGINPPPPFNDPNCRINCDLGTEDQRASPIVTAANSGHVTGYFQELRLSSPEGGAGPWEWLVGAAYLNYKQYFAELLPTPGLNLLPVTTLPVPVNTPAGPVTGVRELQIQDSTKNFFPTEKSVFGEVTRSLGEHWEVTVGGRAFRTSSVAVFVSHGLQTPIFPAPGDTPSTESTVVNTAVEQGINPKFALRYKHNRNAQVYLQVAKGFQFGGPQTIPPAIGEADIVSARGGFTPGAFKSSKLWNYEIGLRTEWLDRRLRLDTTFFYLDWKDLQLAQSVFLTPDETRTNPVIGPTGLGGAFVFNVVGNLAAAHSGGAEIAFEVKPFENVTFSSSVAWISALLDEPYDSPTGVKPAGTRLPGTPHFQMANVLAYQHRLPFTQSWLGGIALTHAHTGVAYTNLDADDATGGYDTLDARLSLGSKDPRWYLPELNLGVSNLTDVRGIGFAETNFKGSPNRFPLYYLIRPRTAIFSLAFNF